MLTEVLLILNKSLDGSYLRPILNRATLNAVGYVLT